MDKLEIIMISKTNQSQKNKYPVYNFIGRSWILKVALKYKGNCWEREKRSVGGGNETRDNNN